eukprot:gene5859-6452_t
MLTGVTFANAVITCSCAYLSLTGSVLIFLSYMIVRTRNTPKCASLIVNLAISDFLWFCAAAVVSSFWLSGNGDVPDAVCYIASPIIIFMRMASLFWTVIISFNVLMSVQNRKWFYRTQEDDWEGYRWKYFAVIGFFALPGTLMSMVRQYEDPDNAGLGCNPRYEPLGLWYEVLFTEALPILLAFVCNLIVFFSVRARMSNAPVPQSVRKKRKRVMYHYVIVCILCWIPTIVLYLMEIGGLHLPILEIVARTSLYLSGFLNFLVFGMQDPHLYRSFFVIVRALGFSSSISTLKTCDVDKSVMFQEEAIARGAEAKRVKRDVYLRSRKLSKEDKMALYSERPDLHPDFRTFRPRRKKSRAVSKSPLDDGSVGEQESLLNGQHTEEEDGGHQQSSSLPVTSPLQSMDSVSSNSPFQRSLTSPGYVMRGSGAKLTRLNGNSISTATTPAGKRTSLQDNFDLDQRESSGVAVSPLQVSLMSDAFMGDPETPGMYSCSDTNPVIPNHESAAGDANGVTNPVEEESEIRMSDLIDESTSFAMYRGSEESMERGESQSSSSSRNDEDLSSEDEIDEEDHALNAVLLPQ